MDDLSLEAGERPKQGLDAREQNGIDWLPIKMPDPEVNAHRETSKSSESVQNGVQLDGRFPIVDDASVRFRPSVRFKREALSAEN